MCDTGGQQFHNGRKFYSTLCNKKVNYKVWHMLTSNFKMEGSILQLFSTKINYKVHAIGASLDIISLNIPWGTCNQFLLKKNYFLEGTAINIIVSNYYNGIIGFVTSGLQAIHGSADNSECIMLLADFLQQ